MQGNQHPPDLPDYADYFAYYGRMPGQVLAATYASTEEMVDAGLQMLQATAKGGRIFSVEVSAGRLSSAQSRMLMTAAGTQPGADRTAAMQLLRLPANGTVAAEFLQSSEPVESIRMAGVVVIGNSSGVVLYIDLHYFGPIPRGLYEMLRNPANLKVSSNWDNNHAWLRRRFPATYLPNRVHTYVDLRKVPVPQFPWYGPVEGPETILINTIRQMMGNGPIEDLHPGIQALHRLQESPFGSLQPAQRLDDRAAIRRYLHSLAIWVLDILLYRQALAAQGQTIPRAYPIPRMIDNLFSRLATWVQFPGPDQIGAEFPTETILGLGTWPELETADARRRLRAVAAGFHRHAHILAVPQLTASLGVIRDSPDRYWTMAEVVEAVVHDYHHWSPLHSPDFQKQVFCNLLEDPQFSSVGPMAELAGVTDAGELTRFLHHEMTWASIPEADLYSVNGPLDYQKWSSGQQSQTVDLVLTPCDNGLSSASWPPRETGTF